MEEEEISGKELLIPEPDYSLAASQITDDLIVEILSRLPFRSLSRSKCVSKPWRDLIAHPAHRKKLPQTLAGVLYATLSRSSRRYTHHLAAFSAEAEADLDPSLAFLPHTEYRGFKLEHACNGLLLCVYHPDAETICFVVCNPATQRWTELPPAPQLRPVTVQSEYHLAFDPAVPSHFHVFHFEHCREGSHMTTVASIYSSRTRAWSQRDTGLVEKVRLTRSSVLVGGMLHAVGISLMPGPCDENRWEDNTVLVAVDMEGKVWKTISVPRGPYYGTVGWSQGCLLYAAISPAPLTVGEDDDEDTLYFAEEIAIWRLEDYDSQQWVLKHSFRIDKVLKIGEVEYQLVGFHPHRDTFFFVSMPLHDGDSWWRPASLLSWDMRRGELCGVLDLGIGTSSPYVPYVPLFSSEPLADADGH